MSAAIRLEDLRVMVSLGGHMNPANVTASEVASVLSDADLLEELVRRGKGRFSKTANGQWFKMWIGDVSE